MDFDGLAIDLDGTLLVGEDLPANNITAVRAARDAGFKIIIATARWHQMALRVAAELEIEGPVIACSGAQVHDPVSGEDVFDQRLPADFVAELSGERVRGAFARPGSIERVEVDPRSGALALEGCRERQSEFFLEGTTPEATCPDRPPRRRGFFSRLFGR